MRDSFVFFRSFFEAAESLNDEDFGVLMRAICIYAFNGSETELSGILKSMLILIKPVLDANKKHQEDGKKGGAPKGNQNARKKTTQKQGGLNEENKGGCFNKTSNKDKDKDMDKNMDGDVIIASKQHDEGKKIYEVECKSGKIIPINLNGDEIEWKVTEAMSGKTRDEILTKARAEGVI